MAKKKRKPEDQPSREVLLYLISEPPPDDDAKAARITKADIDRVMVQLRETIEQARAEGTIDEVAYREWMKNIGAEPAGEDPSESDEIQQ